MDDGRVLGTTRWFRLKPMTQNSQNEPGFPRAQDSLDEYNREEEKVPFPMYRKLL
jgi:hypothetical protein